MFWGGFTCFVLLDELLVYGWVIGGLDFGFSWC